MAKKLCKDCVWCKKQKIINLWLTCTCPRVVSERNYATGEIKPTYIDCSTLREEGRFMARILGLCGKEGRFFVPNKPTEECGKEGK